MNIKQENSIINPPFPQNLKAFCLDFGNTLYDYYSIVYHMINRCWEGNHGYEVNYEDFKKSYDIAFSQINYRLKQKGYKNPPNQGSVTYWAEFYSIMFEELGDLPDVSAQEAKEVTESWSTHPKPKLFPDVVPFLKLCKDKNIKVALLSNTMDTYPRERIIKDKVEKYFDVIALSHEIGAWKPDPKIFNVTSEELGVKNTEIIHIGDEFWQDMLGASQSGIHGIWRVLTINDELITSFRQITSLLDLESLLS
ncbi:MAG: HAD family hydrolase [Candidatus Hodarchaeales archaeon]|jgi:HAD superfamily hydrolase (TIGR01549 family)